MTQFAVPLRVSLQPRSDLERKEDEMRCRTLTLMVAIGVTGWTHSAAADAPQTPAPWPTLNLELRNMTTLSPRVLAEARKTLTRIYHAAGIGVQWKTVEPDFTVFVISTPPPAVRVSGFALGYVPSNKARRGRHAFVLADRVRNRSNELVVSLQLILGLTMAHEVAHLLLPHESHSVNGLMRSVWNASDYRKARLGQLLFTDEEAQLMRDRLSAEPVASQAPH
jgi:hypothetical protein